MKTTRLLVNGVALVSLGMLTFLGVFTPVQPSGAAADTPSVMPVYNVISYPPIKPSETDGPLHDGSDLCSEWNWLRR